MYVFLYTFIAIGGSWAITNGTVKENSINFSYSAIWVWIMDNGVGAGTGSLSTLTFANSLEAGQIKKSAA